MKLNPKPAILRFFLLAAAILLLPAILCFFGPDQCLSRHFVEHPDTLHNHPLIDACRQLGNAWVLLWLGLLAAALTRASRPARLYLLVLVISMIGIMSIKFITQRPRPRDVQAALIHNPAAPVVIRSTPSFPSGDTAQATAAAAILLAFLGWRGLPLLLIPAFVGYFRVAVLAHYPSDVFAGAALGFLSAWLTLWLDQSRTLSSLEKYKFLPPLLIVLLIALPAFLFLDNINPLWIFLRVFALPLLLLILLCRRHCVPTCKPPMETGG